MYLCYSVYPYPQLGASAWGTAGCWTCEGGWGNPSISVSPHPFPHPVIPIRPIPVPIPHYLPSVTIRHQSWLPPEKEWEKS